MVMMPSSPIVTQALGTNSATVAAAASGTDPKAIAMLKSAGGHEKRASR